MAGGQLEREKRSGKFSKLLFEDEVYEHLEMSSKRKTKKERMKSS